METERKFRSRKRKTTGEMFSRKKIIGISAGILCGILAVVVGIYFYVGSQYRTVFFPNTVINGIDASGKTVEEVKLLISGEIDGYTLTLKERGEKTEVITKEEIGLHSVFDGKLEELLAAQKPGRWLLDGREEKRYTVETMIAYDKEKLEQRFRELECLNEEAMIQPENARVSEYMEGTGYGVIPETKGTKADVEKVRKGIEDAILNLQSVWNLEEAGVYIEAEITGENQALMDAVNTLNRYSGAVITYKFGEKRETLDGSTIHQWLSVSDDFSVSLSAEKVAEYVKSLADTYDTYHRAKSLKTSYGETVKISKGFYGWKINQSKETDELAALIRAGERITREPVYSQKANSHGEHDYGDTYVEINLTAQHLFFYKDGKLIVESDFVSGNTSKNWGTPGGAYPLTYKERDATLKGENYRTPVDYWMPFNGNIGMHDADWRSSFGGSIYKTNGSHGCINLPPANAKKIFEHISPGDPVLCYFLEGTESGKTSKPKEEETKPAETKPAETTEVESTEGATKPAESSAEETKAPEESSAEIVRPEESGSSEDTKPEESEESGGSKPDGPGGQDESETEDSRPNGPGEAEKENSRPNGPGESGKVPDEKGPGVS